MADLLSVADAQALVLKDAQPLAAENVPLAQAHGRMVRLAETMAGVAEALLDARHHGMRFLRTPCSSFTTRSSRM